MGRSGGRRWWGIAAVAVVVAACSGSDDAPDLTEATAALFGDDEAPPDGADPADRAAPVADRIAVALEADDGDGAADRLHRVGAVLGHTRAALADAAGDALSSLLTSDGAAAGPRDG